MTDRPTSKCHGCGAHYVGSHACTDAEQKAYRRGVMDAVDCIQDSIRGYLQGQPQEPEIVRAYRALAGQKGGEKP